MNKNKKAFFHTIGCKVNYAETSFVMQKILNEGISVTKEITDADIVVINTCTVTHKADADARKFIRSALRKNPNLFVVVMGCASEVNPRQFEQIEGVSLVIGNQTKMELVNILNEYNILNEKSKKIESKIQTGCSEDNLKFELAYSSENDARTRAFLKIQDGCEYKCSYCIIPQARGKFRSMPFEQILPTIYELQNFGYLEIVLVGINLSEYSYNGKKFFDVIKLLNDADLKSRIRISSIEPNILNEAIIQEFVGSKNLCPHFHIPLQSGSDRILKLMRRKYNSKQFFEKVQFINHLLPDAGIGFDVITGFPTETDNDFEETFNFLEKLKFSYLHTFSYSERKNTEAERIKNKVDEVTKKNRTKKLIELSKKKYVEFALSQLNKHYTFVVETRKNDGYLYGHTENYLEVALAEVSMDYEPFMKIQLISLINDKILSKKI